MNFENIKKIFDLVKPSFYRETWGKIKEEYSGSSRGKSRVLIFFISTVFILDYVMFSYNIDSPILDIFPTIPALEDKKVVDIYIPSKDAKSIISEKREIGGNASPESMVTKLLQYVMEGSFMENTAINVPVRLIVKKVWLVKNQSGQGRSCYIDLLPVILEKGTAMVPGSEKMFRDAIDKTIRTNIPGVTKVLLLEKGVPFRPLWEI